MPPLHDASRVGNLIEVKRLISEDPQAVDRLDNGCTALQLAAYRGHTAVAAYLLDQGADINHTTPNVNATALIFGSERGNLGIVDLLLQRGADATIATSYGRNALMKASTRGHVEVVKLLLRYQPLMVDSRHGGGDTCLWLAAARGHSEVVRLLLEAGADPTLSTYGDEIRPLDVAIKGDKRDCVMYLQEWDRSFLLTKIRQLTDAARDVTYSKLSCLTKRVERGEELPQVKVVGHEQGLVGAVLEYVVYSMKHELFIELMEMMGKTGRTAM